MRFQTSIESDEGICKRALDDIQHIRMQDAIDLLSVQTDETIQLEEMLERICDDLSRLA